MYFSYIIVGNLNVSLNWKLWLLLCFNGVSHQLRSMSDSKLHVYATRYISLTFFASHACSIYNNLIQPSQMAHGVDFHCFKKGIEPKWEDPLCAHGGKWSINTPRGKSLADNYWLYTVSSLSALKKFHLWKCPLRLLVIGRSHCILDNEAYRGFPTFVMVEFAAFGNDWRAVQIQWWNLWFCDKHKS